VDVTKDSKTKAINGAEKIYHYVSMARPNPFIPPLISTLMAKEEIQVENVLQRYPLSNLQVVGVWTLRNKEIKAMVITPSMEGVVAGMGSQLGRRGGKIVAMDDNSITVREYSLASDGSHLYEDLKVWIEQQTPEKKEEKITLFSEKVGLPSNFGYGKKNYRNSPSWEKHHEDILKRLEDEKNDVFSPDDGRPSHQLEQNENQGSYDTRSSNMQGPSANQAYVPPPAAPTSAAAPAPQPPPPAAPAASGGGKK